MSTTRSWRQKVLEADPNFLRKSLRPVVYEFSNGRKFQQPADPYGGLYFVPGALLAEDGSLIFAEDGHTLITVESD